MHKAAVVRNKVRRRLYETIGRIEPDIAGPFDIVINVYQASAADEPFETLEKQLRKQLGEAGVLAKRVK